MVSLGTQPANRKSGFGHSSPTGARAQDLSRQPARPDLWGARVSNDPGLPDRPAAFWRLHSDSTPLWVAPQPDPSRIDNPRPSADGVTVSAPLNPHSSYAVS